MLYSIYAEFGGRRYLEEYVNPIKAYSRFCQLSFRLRKLSDSKLESSDFYETIDNNLDKIAKSSIGFVYCEQYIDSI